ncbi:hypothetical protein ACFQZC_09005 [Streptacidiphilus monticola]
MITLDACAVRGGATAAAATFMVGIPEAPEFGLGAFSERFRSLYVPYDSNEFETGLRYIAGLKGLPPVFRHRAAERLAVDDDGYRAARELLPSNAWGWVAAALRAKPSWGTQTAISLIPDDTMKLKIRIDTALAYLETQDLPMLLPGVPELVNHPDAPSGERLALALAAARRAPEAAVPALAALAVNPLVRAADRREAIDVLERLDPDRALHARAEQMRLPTVAEARERRRAEREREAAEADAARDRARPVAVLARLDAEIEYLVNEISDLTDAESIACDLDFHLADENAEAVDEDVSQMVYAASDDDLAQAIRALGVLTAVRSGDRSGGALWRLEPEHDHRVVIPRLTEDEVLRAGAAAMERSWRVWESIVLEHGWDEDRQAELEGKQEEAAEEGAREIQRLTGITSGSSTSC